MASTAMEPTPFFTMTSFYSLLFVSALLAVAIVSTNHFLPKRSTRDRLTFGWLIFDALIHFSFEAPFVYLSLPGRTVNGSVGLFAQLWQEYAKADSRWGVSDPTVVSIELITVVGAGPLAAYCAYLVGKSDGAGYYWLVVLSVAEIYGGWMTFCPEWLTGSPSLATDNFLYLWVYLFLMNFIWVIVPGVILVDCYYEIVRALRVSDGVKRMKTM